VASVTLYSILLYFILILILSIELILKIILFNILLSFNPPPVLGVPSIWRFIPLGGSLGFSFFYLFYFPFGFLNSFLFFLSPATEGGAGVLRPEGGAGAGGGGGVSVKYVCCKVVSPYIRVE
jgi:hypothetical protein